MAVTWAASAPHASAVKEVAKLLGVAAYGVSDSSVFASFYVGNKRAVLTKLTATGTYTATTGDAIDESLLGLKEIHGAFLVASPTTGVIPVNKIDGVPAVLCTTPTAAAIQMFDEGVEISNGTTLTGAIFHFVLIGI